MEWYLEKSVLEQTLFLITFILVAYFGVIRPGLSLAPWVPTFKRDLERVNTICQEQPMNTFLEAGCGNARVLLYVAKNNPETKCIGIEYSMLVWAWAKARVLFSKQSNVVVRLGDALAADVSDVDVVYTYGLTDTVNQKLMPKLKKEMKPGARFISYAFEIKGEGVVKHASTESSNIYVYTQT